MFLSKFSNDTETIAGLDVRCIQGCIFSIARLDPGPDRPVPAWLFLSCSSSSSENLWNTMVDLLGLQQYCHFVRVFGKITVRRET
jgi:hypothetical protein